MKVGDLVRIKLSDSDPQGRSSGIVLKFDSYRAEHGDDVTPIVNVLWTKGSGWINKDRIEVISGR